MQFMEVELIRYPKKHLEDSQKIKGNGMLISEYTPNKVQELIIFQKEIELLMERVSVQ